MLIRCVAFTHAGACMAMDVAHGLAAQGDTVRVYVSRRLGDVAQAEHYDDLADWTAAAFEEADALLFVGACGIAVRAIAPHVRDKFGDAAVVCVDERANYAIPLLSGHVGGANELARRVGALCGASVAVTTATDVNGLFAVDEWAAENGLVVFERDLAKQVSMALLEGRPVGFASDWPTEGELPDGLVEEGSSAVPSLGIAVTHDVGKCRFSQTLHLVPETVVVGVGCRRGADASRILALVDECLERAHVSCRAVRVLATIDVKAHEAGLLDAARRRGWELRLSSAEELAAVPGLFSSSEFVRQAVGVDNVCERAACACGERLLLGRQSAQGVTVAVAAADPHLSFGSIRHDKRIACVGIGPGGADDMTLRAHKALLSAEVIVGYRTYVDLVRKRYPHAEFVATGMRGEVQRCRMALERASRGARVAVVCSGDPGVYGMAGLLYELSGDYPDVQLEVVPGVTAATGGAAVLGAPLMHDWCAISLSDLMTPWEDIEARLRAAARSGFCMSLYNPASHGRTDHLRRACNILLDHLPEHTVCGMVRNVGREGQQSRVLTLRELLDAPADMLTCVFVGNERTRAISGHMVTPRGYLREGT